MNIRSIPTLFFLLASTLSQAEPTLVWSDEFDYTGLPDSSKWGYDVGGHGWGNNELQYYTENRSDNARVENGTLIIETRKENFQGKNYTSARLVSRGKGDWLYGRFEIRAKLPAGRGTWPAIWMLPTDWVYGGWPDSGEIDIMEHVGYDMQRVHGTIHTKDFNHMIGTQIGTSIVGTNVDTEFHIYALEWRADRIDIFMDGIKYFTVSDNGTGFGAWPFDQRFHLILNIAIGGNWGGVKGVDDSIFPQRMEVDYVRVYDLGDEPPQTGADIPGRIQAEDFDAQFGVQTESTTDTGGGLNVGWLDDGNYMDFALNSPTAGRYAIDLRIASAASITGSVTVTADSNTFTSPDITSTGGWQKWETLRIGEIDLPTGDVTMRLTINTPGVGQDVMNLNWMDISLVKADPQADPDEDTFINLFEEAFGLDMFTADPLSNWPLGTPVQASGNDHVSLTYRRIAGGSGTTGVDYTAGGYQYGVEVSGNLQSDSWQSGSSHIVAVGSPIDNGDGTETVTVRAKTSIADGGKFVRLVVSESP